MNLQHFADGGEPDNTPDNTPDNGVNPDDNKPEVKTYTQEQIDKMIADRVARERKKFGDYEDLKTRASEYEKLLEEKRLAELSEKERLEEIAKKHESEKQTLAQQLAELQSVNKREKVVNEFIKLATSANIAYIDDALKLADLAAVEFDESGKPVGVDAIVSALVQDKPFLLGAKKEPKTIGGSSNPTPDSTAKTAEQLLKEAADKAKRTGRMDDRAAYAALKRELGL
jgi:hypothetical protein